jgi:septal ring factor EnvC (AmiA/AmiB activator)
MFFNQREVTMRRTTSALTAVATTLLLSSALVLSGCTSRPDEAELRQLSELKDEYAALQKEASSKEQQRAALEKEVAERNAKLKKCNDDQQVVKQRLGK